MLAVITVNSLADNFNPGAPTTDGQITLREAILAANANAAVGDAPAGGGADTISLTGLAGVINLNQTFGEIPIRDNLTINGPGQDALTINAGNAGAFTGDGMRIFNVDDSTASKLNVTISKLKLTGGDVGSDDFAGGGAIFSREDISIVDSTLSGNGAVGTYILIGYNGDDAHGGAVYVNGGNLTLLRSTISGNEALGAEAGYRFGGGSHYGTNRAYSGTGGAGKGGGVYVNGGNLTVTDSSISGNTARGGKSRSYFGGGASGAATGGGAFMRTGVASFTRGDLTNNVAEGGVADVAYESIGGLAQGGALYLSAATSTISGSTMSGNTARGGYSSGVSSVFTRSALGGGASGGAIRTAGGSLQINDSTLANNQATAANSKIEDQKATGGAAQGGALAGSGTTIGLTRVNVRNNQAIAGNGLQNFDHTYGGSAIGGGVQINSANLTITECRITGNSATAGAATSAHYADAGASKGGGLYITSGNFSSTASTVADNHSIGGLADFGTLGLHAGDALGGGLFLGAGSHTVASTIISGNDATAASSATALNRLYGGAAKGGGLFMKNGNLAASTSTVSGNKARGGLSRNVQGGTASGGGVYMYLGTAGANSLTQTTISSNEATGGTAAGGSPAGYAYGGGLYLAGGSPTLTQVTISGNSAMGGDNAEVGGTSPAGKGGGLFSRFSSLLVRNSTIAFNSAANNGNGDGVGGGLSHDPGDAVTLSNTIVGKNLATSKPDVGESITANYSLIQSPSGVPISGANNITGMDPLLAPLAANGGLTKTHALQAGSPAINIGDPAAAAGVGQTPSNDQRGAPFSRVAGGRIDVGAYERQTIAGLNLVVDMSADENDGDYSAGDLSLREAIGLANGSVSASDVVSFKSTLSGATFRLTLGELGIHEGVTIQGLGAAQTTIDAGGNDATPTQQNGDGSRVFNIDDGFAADAPVQLNGLTLTGADSNGNGGAIRSVEALTVADSVISGNATTGYGGGLSAFGLVLLRSTVDNNRASFSGGIDAYESVTITDCTISRNISDRSGGGVYVNGQCTLVVSNSTVSGNSANNNGGGIFHGGLSLQISHSTVTGNISNAENDNYGAGGGIYASTDGSPTVTLSNTLVAANVDKSGTGPDIAGAIASRFSLIGDRHGAEITDNGGNLIGDSAGAGVINPLLGPLANNSGTNQTHALLTGSPAIGAGDPAAVAGSGGVPAFDERGAAFRTHLRGPTRHRRGRESPRLDRRL